MDDLFYLEPVNDIVDATRLHLSTIRPSVWYEKNMVMPRGSASPGPFSFEMTPYWREPLDCIAKDHPAKEVSIMKGAQLGGTAAVLNPIVGYMISQNPGNTMFLTGHTDLTDAAFVKIDHMIDNCGIRDLIRPNVNRAKSSRTGDTGKLKEFPGGTLWSGSVTNHNLLRQYDVMIMIVDDFDAAPMSSTKAGSTRELVQHRTNAFAHKKKIIWVSSPQIEGLSNIEDVFYKGDQRYYNVPCPCCQQPIILQWSIDIDSREKAGITWKTDENGHLIRDSVGYICQKCAGFFTSSHKYEMNRAGFWVPTVIPIEENHYSYQISSLYSPPFMDDWHIYVQRYMNANPAGGKVIEEKNQTFTNIVLGLPYKQKGKSVDSNTLQQNIRNYEVGIVPEWKSHRDGNGKIVMLTCAADMNGVMKDDRKDVRLDYEVKAWTESGASYSITHGSIGTFVFQENKLKQSQIKDRARWTYEHGKPNSVWPEFEKVLNTIWQTDTGGKMKILLTGLDTGHFTTFAYAFIDKTKCQNVIGLKGNKESEFRKFTADAPIFKPAQERVKLYLVDVNKIKDTLAADIEQKWDGSPEVQPADFMNFPTPSKGLYLHKNYFIHYEAEERVIENKDGEGVAAVWKKKTAQSQNHFYDCAVYGYALREIWADMVFQQCKPKRKGNWHDFVAYAKSQKKI
jgi:phage terminase large subunit GpA-like protein